MEYEKPIRFLAMEQSITCLVQQVRNVEDAERIGAFNNKTLATSQFSQHLAGPQRRQGTGEATQVKEHGEDFRE